MTKAMRLDIPLVLPGVPDERDACVARLSELLERRPGVESIHVLPAGTAPASDALHVGQSATVAEKAALCLHYDPELLTLREIVEIAADAGAGITRRYGHEVIPVNLVGAEDAAGRVEGGLKGLYGVTAASMNMAAQLVRIEYDTSLVDHDAIRARLRELGAPSRQELLPTPGAATAELPSWYHRNRELAWSLTAGAFLLAGVAAPLVVSQPLIPITLFVIAYLFGARDNVGHLVKDLTRGRFHFDIDLLMILAAAGAAILGQWAEGALLLFLFSLGHALEHYALGRARNAIKALADLAPQEATVMENGVSRRVPVAQVRTGVMVLIKPGERVAVDGTVREGVSAVNQAPITGESVPVDKSPGEQVFAGSVNGDGALVVEVSAAAGDRTLDRVIKLVAEAQTQKAPTQQFTDRFERIFVPVVLVGDALLMVVPPLLGVWTWHDAIYRALTVLVASSPCALALGTPAAVLAGIAQAARKGVLIKGGAHLESLGAITAIALDKTGTITEGRPTVTDVVATEGTSEDEMVALAAAVEAKSQHPLAHAVLAEAARRKLNVQEAGDVEAVSGRGVRGRVGPATVEIGRLLMFQGENDGAATAVPATMLDAVERLEQAGRTAIIVRRTGEAWDGTPDWLGVLGIADAPRGNAAVAIANLRSVGMRRIIMLTGDNERVGRAVASEVGIEEVRAGLLPEDKLHAIKELTQQGPIAMVGDGVNDAPALAHATVGIAMGGAGTAAALETADVALMGDDLERLAFAIGLSRLARAIIRQNLTVSLGVIAVLVIAAVTGQIGIGAAVVFHEGSTLVVIANGLRLLGYSSGAKRRRESGPVS
jgi:Cd2+/Zn2+-exporting ATPase